MNKRITMSQTERQLLQANKVLVEKQQILLKDIHILISFIRGNKNVTEETINIINYYLNKSRSETKYDK